MDKYNKILLIVVVLVYLNAMFFYLKDVYVDKGMPGVGNIGLDTKKPGVKIPGGTSVSFDNGPEEVKKTTNEGHIIEQEYGAGDIKIDNFTFDQELSKIKTVLVSFKTLKIQPKPYCFEEEVIENVSFQVPKFTGMTISEDDLRDTKIPNIDQVGFTGLVYPYTNETESNIHKEKNATQIEYETLTEIVSHYVTKCQTSDEIFLSSIFGTVDIMQNDAAIATYSLTFRKEERDDKIYEYLVVEKDIFLPQESGRYGLRVIIWDKISGNRVEHDEEFFVK
ncbi:MAG: hypothetical protein WC755_05380 [Candidatus Woesearchaeota archaeon]|jgi:hypothetical protein